MCKVEFEYDSTKNKPAKKIRELKGKDVNMHVNDYCVVDIETTGILIDSSKIIEISALKVRDNIVTDEYSTLINPQCHIPKAASSVNHITDKMVENAPLIEDILDDFLMFIGDDIIVGYNNATFDMNFIYDVVKEVKGISFSNDYIDVLYAVRRSLHNLNNSKLETVSNYYGLNTVGEHRALKDCYLTKECYDLLFREFGDKAFTRRNYYKHCKEFHYTAETIALKELHTILEEILDDNVVTIDEINTLHCWMKEHLHLSKKYPFDKIFDALKMVLEDGAISDQELNDLKYIFEEITDPVNTCKSDSQVESISQKHICITGDFDYGNRICIKKLIALAGGIIDDNVKKNTNYVIVGNNGSDAWKTGNYGTKIQKAMELNLKGYDIKIMKEKDFIPNLLKLIRKKRIGGINE